MTIPNQPKPPPAPKAKPRRRRGHVPLDDERKALIWVEVEAGHTYRDIAKKLNVSTSAISMVLRADPLKFESIRSALKEERAKAYAKLNTSTLEHCQAIADRVGRLARKARVLTDAEQKDLVARSTALRTLKAVNAGALAARELLTGGPTERIATQQTFSPAEMTPDQIIEMHIRLGIEDQLPPIMRAVAKARIKAGQEGTQKGP